MALRIACDLDGTVADMDSALEREARSLFGPDVTLYAVPPPPMDPAADEGQSAPDAEAPRDEAQGTEASEPAGRVLTRNELRQLWQHVGQIDGFWRSLGEIEPGAVARLFTLATRYQWEVLFLTQRPRTAGEIAQLQSQRWLQAHGFEIPSVFVMHGSRGRVAQALSLDAVLDDRPENCLDVLADSKAIPFLVWREQRGTVPPGVGRTRIQTVYSMGEALDRLEALTAERTAPKGLLHRVRNAMGI